MDHSHYDGNSSDATTNRRLKEEVKRPRNEGKERKKEGARRSNPQGRIKLRPRYKVQSGHEKSPIARSLSHGGVALKLIPEREEFISLLMTKGQDYNMLKKDIQCLVSLLLPFLNDVHSILWRLGRPFNIEVAKKVHEIQGIKGPLQGEDLLWLLFHERLLIKAYHVIWCPLDSALCLV
ncbi:hypothetical protein QJS10_CPB13g00975 [Acorus calamus]|uniref:Uncharacterized protein n=1 Tax=Acorus calamus TaxID=4465 RepID=A0AAV9DJB4_ACOCL|nr:hypothetical protein QJS10_CPB13g00975 [Acorus calamus]